MKLLKAHFITRSGKAAEAQGYPFFKHRAELEETLRFVFDEIRISDAKQLTSDPCVRHSAKSLSTVSPRMLEASEDLQIN